MRYHHLGDIPEKPHTQFRRDDVLLTEELIGLEGFSGNESLIYHLNSPCWVRELGEFVPIRREEWVPAAHAHRHMETADLDPGGDPITGRRLLMWNADVEISICRPDREQWGFYRNGEGDEVIFVHEGGGVLHSIYGDLPFKRHDYIVIPRGTTYRFENDGPQTWLTFFTPGEIETPARYRNRYGQLLEHAPFSHRDLHPPRKLKTYDERGEFDLTLRVRDGYQRYLLDYHPFDVVGWDGFVYPYTFNVADFQPITGRLHMPPPIHQTFEGQNFVICSFCPRELDYDSNAIPLPYHHSNVHSEEMLYYVEGEFGSRRGVNVGSVTLHPSGLPHGPQPGLVEKSLGARRTEELAVMCDTFNPLHLTALSQSIEDPSYPYSWAPEPANA